MRQSDIQRRPTMLNGCAMAATAAEARFRITYPFPPRDSRIVAVDEVAAEVVRRACERAWSGSAHFLTFEAPLPRDRNGSAPDARLRTCGGSAALLSEELAEADVVVMVAGNGGAQAAALIGRACAERGITAAGVALTEPGQHADDAVLALRPFAMVLVVSEDGDDLLELLTALRA